MYFSNYLILGTLLSSFSIDHVNADMLRRTKELEEVEEHSFELLSPESEYGFELPEDGFEPSLELADIEMAPENRASNSTHDRKLASYNNNELQMARYINYERTRRGLQALYWSADLLDESQRWSNYMARTGNFHHRNPLGQNIRGYRRLAENIANHWSIAYSGAHTSLMNSPGHRRNILNPNMNRIGVGVRRNSRGQYYVTEIFKQV